MVLAAGLTWNKNRLRRSRGAQIGLNQWYAAAAGGTAWSAGRDAGGAALDGRQAAKAKDRPAGAPPARCHRACGPATSGGLQHGGVPVAVAAGAQLAGELFLGLMFKAFTP